jgi:hypothetical protein
VESTLREQRTAARGKGQGTSHVAQANSFSPPASCSGRHYLLSFLDSFGREFDDHLSKRCSIFRAACCGQKLHTTKPA